LHAVALQNVKLFAFYEKIIEINLIYIAFVAWRKAKKIDKIEKIWYNNLKQVN